MSTEEYPGDIEIKKTNFKTDQQQEAAETIAEQWPVGLDTLAEEEGHVEMFYSRVLEEFLGPVEADMTFSEIESEYGSVEQWTDDGADGADDADVEVPDVDDIEPGAGTVPEGDGGGSVSSGDDASIADLVEGVDLDAVGAEGSDVDERRREWFAAGFREGVEFALRNPDLFGPS